MKEVIGSIPNVEGLSVADGIAFAPLGPAQNRNASLLEGVCLIEFR
jgi:hypothetical protein